ncbi:MAG: baseplate J/gp47 family protein [Pyrinomonadaceae bacterium]
MNPQDGKIIINGAASQYDRWLRALDADYAKVDGRTLSELLDFAVEFASLINFHNLRNEIEGDWVPFFLTDPTMLLASLEAADPSGKETEFARLEQRTIQEQFFDKKFVLLRDTFQFILGLAQQLDLCLRLPDARTDGETMRLLRHAIVSEIKSSLSNQLRTLKAYDLGAGETSALGRPIGLSYEGFSPIWKLKRVAPDGAIYRGRTNNRKIDRALTQLAPIFNSFLYAISDLKLFAQANLPTTLNGGNHKPQIALYIAFATLFQTAQDTINTLSSRYTRFYYRDILRETNRAALPDNVYLSFALDTSEDVLSTTVPLDTLFPAGEDAEGRAILYGSDKDLLVTSASIARLLTLRVTHENLIPTESDSSIVVKRVISSEIALLETTGAQSAWATFGETEVGKTDREVTELATLGFALASSYLSMTGGARSVRVQFWCSDESLAKLLMMLGELSGATSLPSEKIFETVLLKAFTLFVSMSAGWFPIESYTITGVKLENAGEPVFELQFELPSNVPPVVAYNPAGEEAVDDGSAKVVTDDAVANSSNPAPSLPTLKAYLRQQPISLSGASGTVDVYPLSLLGEIAITAFRINIDVFGLANLQLANTDGEIDTSTPFTVFGGMPVVGSYLLISHSELFAKILDSLWITITWFNLPQNEDGFQGYYKDYVIGLDGKPRCNLFNNAVFHGSMSIQKPGKWFLSGTPDCPEAPLAGVDLLLFRTKPYCNDTSPAGPLCSFTNFDNLKVCECTPPPYYSADESAIKLELTEPPYAFGADLYSLNVLNSVLEDLPDTEICQQQCLSSCQVLLDAALCIEACLMCLADCTDPVSQCIELCLSVCLKCLIDLCVQCLSQCIDESRGLPVEDALRRNFAQLKMSLAATNREQSVEACKKLLAESVDIYGDVVPECVKQCVEKCITILDAIVCILNCEKNCDDQTQCLMDCLTTCKQQLDDAYKVCLEKCMTDCLSLKETIKYPNNPYLPQATSVTVNYSAHCTGQSAETEEASSLFFHLLPFGGYNQLKPSEEEPKPLLPHFLYTGNLYIGFSALIPPQTLTLLFQMAANAYGDYSVELPAVAWEYLSNNRWNPLGASSIRADSTNGLQNSGIITLGLPAYNPTNNTVLPADNQWLRASVTEQADRFPETIGIYPHAVIATWRDNDNTGENLAKPLQPFTINSSVEDLPDIASITQPMESFGGRPPETGRTFDIRVGERLRHKERAILSWDYERLVLERFPTVWKVQALPARNLQQGDAPGSVLVVIVPGPETAGVVDTTVPTATAEMLEQIKEYLEGLSSPFIQLQVVNPVYVRIEVNATVQFNAASDAGAYIKRLNDELVQYLSPWFYDANRAAKGGRYISEADISEFIQTRPYVEAMTAIKLILLEPNVKNMDWYFLTSAQQHKIQVKEQTIAEVQTGY